MNRTLTLVPSSAKILRQTCPETTQFPYWLPGEMMLLMLQSKGIGLAAPQVGRHERMFVTGWGDVFINPVIVETTTDCVTAVEGCLSLPGVQVNVPRPSRIVMSDGRRYEGNCARVIQHELDHLNGKLITDYV